MLYLYIPRFVLIYSSSSRFTFKARTHRHIHTVTDATHHVLTAIGYIGLPPSWVKSKFKAVSTRKIKYDVAKTGKSLQETLAKLAAAFAQCFESCSRSRREGAKNAGVENAGAIMYRKPSGKYCRLYFPMIIRPMLIEQRKMHNDFLLFIMRKEARFDLTRYSHCVR